jgi:hypothetical protein
MVLELKILTNAKEALRLAEDFYPQMPPLNPMKLRRGFENVSVATEIGWVLPRTDSAIVTAIQPESFSYAPT